MRKIIIEKSFINYYLTSGRTHDNFIFENCPIEFINEAEKLLKSSTTDTKSCVIRLSRDIEENLEKTLSQCENDFQKSIIARDLFLSIFMTKLIELSNGDVEQKEKLENGINAILSGDFEKSKKYHVLSPMPYDITKMIRKIGDFELNIFLINTKNKFLQQAINNFISAREPYSIKVFATSSQLPSYLDQNGNLMQSPHDFMFGKVKENISFDEQSLNK